MEKYVAMFALRRCSSALWAAIMVADMKHSPCPTPASTMQTAKARTLPVVMPTLTATKNRIRVIKPAIKPLTGLRLRCENCVVAAAIDKIRKASPGTAGPFQGSKSYRNEGISEASRLPDENIRKDERLARRKAVRVDGPGKA